MFKTSIDPQKFHLFLEINELLNTSFSDLNSLFATILHSVSRLTEAEASSLLLLNPETHGLEFVVALGTKGDEVKAFSLKRGEGIAGWVAENNQALIVNDVQTDSRFYAEISKNVGFSTHSILAVPLRVKGSCVGTIELINKVNGSYFSIDDQVWAEVFANQAGLAFQNAKSFQTVVAENRRLREFVDHQANEVIFVTQSPSVLNLLDLCKKFALTDSSILIQGESGTGKELLAEYIFHHSLRSKGPFVRVNCAALPEGLLESELFGHVKGAFTDATQAHIGKFESASGGTIFLDEVGELSTLAQAKLLRVLQTRKLERLGSVTNLDIDVRVITASSRDLQKEMDEGRFRRDLYYRLNVLPIWLPPLRQRPEDISLLAQFFVKEIARRLRKTLPKLTKSAMNYLEERTWPGNVRELQNVLERGMILSDCTEISEKELKTDDLNRYGLQDSFDLRGAVQAFKKAFIQKVMAAEAGNQTRTAVALGIQRTYLSKLLKDFELDDQE